MPVYSLKAILSTFSNSVGKKRLIFDLGPIGGISSNAIKLIFMSMPFIEYALIFNPYVFNALGIAQCIILYIVFLSIIMIAIFLITWSLKKKVIDKINPSWKHYFESIELETVVSEGITPYSRFFEYYAQALKETKDENELYKYLQDSFKKMEEENKDLIAAINRKNNNL